MTQKHFPKWWFDGDLWWLNKSTYCVPKVCWNNRKDWDQTFSGGSFLQTSRKIRTQHTLLVRWIRQNLGPLPNSKGPSGYKKRRLLRFAKRFFATQRLTTCLSTSYIQLEFIWPIQLWYLDYKKHLLAIDVKITYLIHTCSFLFTLQTICLPFSPLSRKMVGFVKVSATCGTDAPKKLRFAATGSSTTFVG